MTYPDSGAPADPREELEAIRRRLAEITSAGPRGAGNGLMVAGSLALATALAVLLVAIAVASTLDGGGAQAAVLIAGFCILAGFAVLGLSLLRRWQSRVALVRRERLELLTRYDTLAAGMGEPRAVAYQPAYPQNGADRVRMVAGLTLGVIVLLAVVVTILVRVH